MPRGRAKVKITNEQEKNDQQERIRRARKIIEERVALQIRQNELDKQLEEIFG